jgi:hypothetical protein
MRVLAFAFKPFPARDALTYNDDAKSYPTDGLVFLGLTALVDPPKDGVADTVLTCHRAGIRFTMVTGDHPLTAEVRVPVWGARARARARAQCAVRPPTPLRPLPSPAYPAPHRPRPLRARSTSSR